MVGDKERRFDFGRKPEVSEQELIRRAKRGDEEARNALFGGAIDKVYSYVFHRIGNRWEAEDLTERTLLRAVEHFDQFKPRDGLEQPFSSWVYKIAGNLVKNWYRDTGTRSKREIVIGTIVEKRMDEEVRWELERPEERVIKNEEKRRVWKAIKKLPQHYQDVLILKYTTDLSNKDIGAVMGERSEGAVKSLLRRALKKLGKKLEEE